jgi:hypothetical protein
MKLLFANSTAAIPVAPLIYKRFATASWQQVEWFSVFWRQPREALELALLDRSGALVCPCTISAASSTTGRGNDNFA